MVHHAFKGIPGCIIGSMVNNSPYAKYIINEVTIQREVVLKAWKEIILM
jgi:hypothetical protein